VLVDILDPAHATYTVDASGTLRLTIPPEQAKILVPSDQVVQGA